MIENRKFYVIAFFKVNTICINSSLVFLRLLYNHNIILNLIITENKK
jgi:hypothetical protein